MLLRPFLNDATSCASYLFGCGTQAKLAVVDPHTELVDDYLATAAALGAPPMYPAPNYSMACASTAWSNMGLWRKPSSIPGA